MQIAYMKKLVDIVAEPLDFENYTYTPEYE